TISAFPAKINSKNPYRYSKIYFSFYYSPFMTSLRTLDIVALGFMTFALFIGAGNIIFPPIVAQQAGEHVWLAAFGFLITAVGLPVITIIALSRVEGSIQALSSPLGKAASILLT